MRKYCSHKQLGLRYRLSARRRAFSLAELVISMGILVLMMSLAGQVFNITVQSTGQATALTEVMQQLRSFEHTLRDDLRSVQPGNSLILIQGNPVNAYWTQTGKDADDDAATANAGPATGYSHPADPEREDSSGNGNSVAPRADILMIFTARPGASFVDAGTAQPTSNLQQVVYGHAELGEYVPNPNAGAPSYIFQPDLNNNPELSMFPSDMLNGALYPSTTKVAATPAAQWHLARRSVLLLPTDPPAVLTPPMIWLDDSRLLECETDVFRRADMGIMHNFRYEDDVLRPQLSDVGLPIGGPWFLPKIFGDVTDPYALWRKPFARSRLDPTPPALYANRIGHYLLPNCASFKVEWTLNPRSEFVAGRLDAMREVLWFDPGDPTDPLRTLADAAKNAAGAAKQSLECFLGTRTNGTPINECHPEHPDGMRYSLSDRFRGIAFPGADQYFGWETLAPDKRRPNLVVFTATRPSPPPPGATPGAPLSEPVLDPMFPGALRITVDVFDKDRRLDRPIRHVMVIPIGG